MTAVSEKRDFLLATMRVASLNLKSWANEIDVIGIALRNNLMTVEAACEDLNDMGVLYWLPEPKQDAVE